MPHFLCLHVFFFAIEPADLFLIHAYPNRVLRTASLSRRQLEFKIQSIISLDIVRYLDPINASVVDQKTWLP